MAKGDASPESKTSILFVIIGLFMALVGGLASYALWKDQISYRLLMFVNLVNSLLFLVLLISTTIIGIVVWVGHLSRPAPLPRPAAA